MSGQIALNIGPAPSAVAREWILNRKRLIGATRASSAIRAEEDVLDLLDTFLDLWLIEVDRSETFTWTHRIDPEVLVLIGRYWLDLGQLSPTERAAMGAPLAPPEIEEFTIVVVDGMTAALRAAGPRGQELLDRLGL